MILLQDPVASVRRDSFKGVTCLLNNMYDLAKRPSTADDALLVLNSKQHLEEIARAINSLVCGEKYQLRQLWVELCHELLRDLPREIFEHYFVQGILTLTSDTVSNVRVALAYFLVDWGADHLAPWEQSDSSAPSRKETPWHWLLQRSDIRECVLRLSRDDNDVFLNLSKLQPLFPEVVFSSMSCRGRKAPPGGLLPVVYSSAVGGSSSFQSKKGVDGANAETQPLDAFSDENSLSGYSNSGLNVGVITDIHIHSNRSSFSSNHDEDTQAKHSLLGDMTAIDIELVPRNRASSFPAMEFLHTARSDLPVEIDDELDIIDGILKASPKHSLPPVAALEDEERPLFSTAESREKEENDAEMNSADYGASDELAIEEKSIASHTVEVETADSK